MACSIAAKQAWLLVGLLWVAYFLNYSDRQLVFSIFPILRSELHFTDVELGLTGALFLWVYALCSPIAGQIGDRYPKRRLVTLSLLLWSAATIAMGFSVSPNMVLACRVTTGITEALFVPAAIALIAGAHSADTRSRAISLFGTAQLSGVVMGGWYSGVVAQKLNWRLAFYSLGLVGIVYAVPFWSFLRNTNDDNQLETKRSGTRVPIAVLSRVQSFWLLCFVFAAFTIVLWLYYAWLPDFLYNKFKLSLQDAALAATIYLQSATLVGLLLGGSIGDWLYQRTRAARSLVVCAGLFVAAPCLYLVGNSASIVFTRLSSIGLGLGSGLVIANIFVSIFEVVPADTGASAVGFFNLIGGLVSGFGALAGGLWKQEVGIGMMMSYASVLYAGAALILLFGIKLYFQRDYDRVH